MAKGLKFIPYKNISKDTHCKSLDTFNTNLHSYATPFKFDTPRHSYLPNKPGPDCSNHSRQIINKFIEATKLNLQQTDVTSFRTNNLTNQESHTLNNLAKRTDIIIKKSDKGDKITVETVESYVRDGLKHLNNEEVYHRITRDINSDLSKAITDFVLHAFKMGYINKDIFDFLTAVKEPRTPLIYFFKKLHKNPIAVRLIVSNTNSPTCQLSAFIDILLKPIVNEHEQILKNTTQLINEIENLTCPANTILVTADVVSLYPSIPITDSINVICNFLKEYNHPTYPPVIIINTLLSFILRYNCFTFANLFFLQVRGIAMGTKMAPNYANLYMAHIEKKSIFTYKIQSHYYRRYIDDIFSPMDFHS